MPSRARPCVDCGKTCYSRSDQPRCKQHAYVWNKKYENKGTAQWVHHLKKYGLDLEGFHVLWIAFQGKCGICKIDLTKPLKQRGQPSSSCTIDHCHITGNVRGLLCSACNKGIGLLRDSPELLTRAAWWTTKEN